MASSVALGNLADSSFYGNLDDRDCRDAAAVMEAKALPLIVAAMERFPECEVLQGSGCLALGNLARRVGIDRVMETKPLPLIVAAMKQFPECEVLQRYGCPALGNLACDDGYTISDSSMYALGDPNCRNAAAVIVRDRASSGTYPLKSF